MLAHPVPHHRSPSSGGGAVLVPPIRSPQSVDRSRVMSTRTPCPGARVRRMPGDADIRHRMPMSVSFSGR